MVSPLPVGLVHLTVSCKNWTPATLGRFQRHLVPLNGSQLSDDPQLMPHTYQPAPQQLGVKISGVNQSGIGCEIIITTGGYSVPSNGVARRVVNHCTPGGCAFDPPTAGHSGLL